MTNTVENRILEWLQTQGYPLEMKVATALRQSGFGVFQSEYYIDPETEGLREIDILASYLRNDRFNPFVANLLIECKGAMKGGDSTNNLGNEKNGTEKRKSKSGPWLLFSAQNEDRENSFTPINFDCIPSTSMANEFLREKKITERISDFEPLFILKKHCYGMTQAFTSGNDICFSAIKSVTKAAKAQLKKIEEVEATEQITGLCFFFIPIIVTEEQLFKVFTGADGAIKIEKIESGVVLAPPSTPNERQYAVHVVCAAYFEDYLGKLLRSINAFYNFTEIAFKSEYGKNSME